MGEESLKKCIVIGSGSDIVGRGLGSRIDAGEFGEVCRITRHYGEDIDVGTKTDKLFSFQRLFWRNDCVRRWGEERPYGEFINPFSLEKEVGRVAQIAGKLEHPSTGFWAIFWLIHNGYFPTLIGYGFKDGKLVNKYKTYPNGMQEREMKWHNFMRENDCLYRMHFNGKLRLL